MITAMLLIMILIRHNIKSKDTMVQLLDTVRIITTTIITIILLMEVRIITTVVVDIPHMVGIRTTIIIILVVPIRTTTVREVKDTMEKEVKVLAKANGEKADRLCMSTTPSLATVDRLQGTNRSRMAEVSIHK